MTKWDLRPLGVGPDEPRMKLFLITRTERVHPPYDVVNSMVVRAENETEARFLASQKAIDEGAMMWLQPSMSHCEEISTNGEAQVLCVDATNG